jgi:Ankyrin repeats (3 copies)
MRVIHVITILILLFCSSLVVFSQNSKQELNDQFWEAVRRGDVAAVTTLLDKGAEVNAKFRYGTTALFKAAERGNLEIVKILLARGADVTVKDTFYGATAMTWALDNGHTEVVKELLEKQPASVSDVLMSGVRRERPELMKLALAKGKLSKETLTTALVVASNNKEKPELAELLKSAGAVPPPQINNATLQSYVGKYKSDGPLEVTITLSDGNLSAVPTGQRPQPLIAVDDTTFRALFAENIIVRFKVEDAKVTGFALTQGQTTTQLTRVVETKQP